MKNNSHKGAEDEKDTGSDDGCGDGAVRGFVCLVGLRMWKEIDRRCR